MMYNSAMLANLVREAILLNPRVSAQDIMVVCKEGRVTLTGAVDTPDARQAAEVSAVGVEGVCCVENRLFVRSGRWPPLEPEVLP